MKAKDLKPGDLFNAVGHEDPECAWRICLTNDKGRGLRFGFPNRPGYWCYMGELVDVKLINIYW